MNPSAIKGQITKLNKRLAKLAPGEVLRLDNCHIEVYHGCNGVSTSKIKTFLECPAKYHARYITGEVVQEPKTAFDLGKAAHSRLLEADRFDQDNVVQPDDIKVRRGKKWDAFKEEHPTQTIITGDQMEAVKRMYSAVQRNSFGRGLLNGGKSEVSFFKCDEETGLIIKCRTDYLLGDLIVDLKTCVSSHPEAFAKHAISFGYHIQDALYRDVIGLPEFAFVAIEKEAPHVVTAPLLFDEEARRLGYKLYRQALTQIAECMIFDVWPGYTDEPVLMGLKPWDKKQLEKIEEKEAA